jgi:hypothetical protein
MSALDDVLAQPTGAQFIRADLSAACAPSN